MNDKKLNDTAMSFSIDYMERHYEWDDNIDEYVAINGKYEINGDCVQDAYIKGFKDAYYLLKNNIIL